MLQCVPAPPICPIRADLLDRAQVTTRELRDELEKLHPAGWGWALACCGRDREEASETLQTAYVRILEGRARFRGHSAVRTGVFGVIRMVARERRVQAIRSARRELRELSVVSDPHAEVSADWIADDEEANELRTALRGLSRRQQEVLTLVFYSDLTIEQAAEVMKVAVGTARTHYDRGKRRLRELLTCAHGVRR